MKVKIIRSVDKDFIDSLIKKDSDTDVKDIVSKIINEVKINGDNALRYYAKKFDDILLEDIEVNKEEIKEAYDKISISQLEAIRNAAANIRKFAEFQFPKSDSIDISKGIKCGFRITPIEKIGCYIPGGKYPLPSTVMMTVVPAKVAGVKEIYLTTPKADPAILVAADVCGVDKVFQIGGAQAIAALAYGTRTIQKVDKIVGPGNIFVTEAKKQVFGDVGIDMLAGPSEILILSKNGNPKFIASDMLAQAEHDENATAILITPFEELASSVERELQTQAFKLSNRSIIERSFCNNSCIIVVEDIEKAITLSNLIAPEHLEIDSSEILDKITNAGSIFIGKYSCEAAGDYASGTNHVLPTMGNSRFRGGLSVFDFVKIQTYQELTKDGLKKISKSIMTLADMENLSAHKNSVLKRFEDNKEV